jgi:hypothetical protein
VNKERFKEMRFALATLQEEFMLGVLINETLFLVTFSSDFLNLSVVKFSNVDNISHWAALARMLNDCYQIGWLASRDCRPSVSFLGSSFF